MATLIQPNFQKSNKVLFFCCSTIHSQRGVTKYVKCDFFFPPFSPFCVQYYVEDQTNNWIRFIAHHCAYYYIKQQQRSCPGGQLYLSFENKFFLFMLFVCLAVVLTTYQRQCFSCVFCFFPACTVESNPKGSAHFGRTPPCACPGLWYFF